MELVLNKYQDSRNHLLVVNELIDGSSDIMLAVAFVKASGVDAILEKLADKKVKILCSLSFLSSEHRAFRKLLNQGHELRFCNPEKGILHTKIWLFSTNKTQKALIGSANLTLSALVENMEASILLDKTDDADTIKLVYGYFKYLWDKESAEINEQFLEKISEIEIKQTNLYHNISKHIPRTPPPKNQEKYLLDFIKSWIDIDVDIKIPGQPQSKLWRGWYIIPDQGLIDDNLMLTLKSIMEIILNNDNCLDTNDETIMRKVYSITKETFISPKKLDNRTLFIRQQKNYLLKFGFVDYPQKPDGKPDKDVTCLTESGKKIAKLRDDQIDEYKEIYANNMDEYQYNGFKMYPFVLKLLHRFGYLDFFEFSSFVKHVYNDDKLELVASLISIYRDCSAETQKRLHKYYKDYFDEVLEPTAKSVRANYEKSIKHQMSALGWMPNCFYDKDRKVLQLL